MQFEIQIRLPVPRRRYPIHSFCDGDSRIVRRAVNHAVQQIVSGQLLHRRTELESFRGSTADHRIHANPTQDILPVTIISRHFKIEANASQGVP